jgi:hypothetical protein
MQLRNRGWSNPGQPRQSPPRWVIRRATAAGRLCSDTPFVERPSVAENT